MVSTGGQDARKPIILRAGLGERIFSEPGFGQLRAGSVRVPNMQGFPSILMVGLGETDAEVMEVLADLRRHAVDIVTIGQYLSPGPKHLPVDRFVTPEQFEQFRLKGEMELGFLQVVSTPLTRSSYHAGEVQRLMQEHPR